MRAALRVTCPPDEEVPSDHTDEHERLMKRVELHRDRDAFEELFRYFGPRVKALMLKAGADVAQAEDLVQDVMIKVWNKAHLYVRERGSVSAWVFGIARNARIDRLRQKGSQPYEDVYSLELESDGLSADDAANGRQQARRISEALLELPHAQRQVIELAFIKDMTQSDIAEALSIPMGTVKSRMRIAYNRLRTKLEDLK